ncbi:MAG: hypothetical protein ACYDAD_08540 [Acidimicrobiales bacterium]
MPGAIALVLVMVLVVPPLLFGTGLVLAALLGWLLRDEAVSSHEGSELIELNR